MIDAATITWNNPLITVLRLGSNALLGRRMAKQISSVPFVSWSGSIADVLVVRCCAFASAIVCTTNYVRSCIPTFAHAHMLKRNTRTHIGTMHIKCTRAHLRTWKYNVLCALLHKCAFSHIVYMYIFTFGMRWESVSCAAAAAAKRCKAYTSCCGSGGGGLSKHKW